MPKDDKAIVAVSNGRALLDFQLGSIIDGFDHVVRINHAVLTDDLAPHIGTKTTIWVFSDWPPDLYCNTSPRYAHCRKVMALPDNPDKRSIGPPSEVELIPLSFERKLRQQICAAPGLWCTTGLVALAWLLREFDVIHTAGWFVGDAGCLVREFQKHYDQPELSFHKFAHDLRAEASYFQKWVSSGRIVPLE